MRSRDSGGKIIAISQGRDHEGPAERMWEGSGHSKVLGKH